MAKELPYFKFFPGEYLKGDITICSMTAQGLFINICALYWAKEGRMEIDKIRKRYERNTTELQELFDNDILIESDGKIIINFLDDQLQEREMLSEQNRSNVLERWKNIRSNNERNTSVIRNDTIKRREEKKREEKKRKEEVIFPFTDKKFIDHWQLWKDFKKEQFQFSYKTIGEQAALKKLGEMSATMEVAINIINQSIDNGWKGFFELKNNGAKESTTDRAVRMARKMAEEREATG